MPGATTATSTARTIQASSRLLSTPRRRPEVATSLPPLPVVARFLFLAISREQKRTPERRLRARVANGLKTPCKLVQKHQRPPLHRAAADQEPRQPRLAVFVVDDSPDPHELAVKFVTTTAPFPPATARACSG